MARMIDRYWEDLDAVQNDIITDINNILEEKENKTLDIKYGDYKRVFIDEEDDLCLESDKGIIIVVPDELNVIETLLLLEEVLKHE